MTGVRRRVERWLLVAASSWMLVLAAVTLFPYQYWMREQGIGALAHNGEVGQSVIVSQLSGVVIAYGLVLVLSSVAGLLLAWKIATVRSSTVIWYLSVCGAGAVLTRDIVGGILFVVILVVYIARNRAVSRARNAVSGGVPAARHPRPIANQGAPR